MAAFRGVCFFVCDGANGRSPLHFRNLILDSTPVSCVLRILNKDFHHRDTEAQSFFEERKFAQRRKENI